MRISKFRNCLLNETERTISKDGKHLDLSTKTFDVLLCLVERAGKVVSKDELLGKVWDGSFVEEGNLAVHVSKLRRALGETETERFVETVQGNGYRFIAAVSQINETEWKRLSSNNGNSQIAHSVRRSASDLIAVLPLKNESNNPDVDYLADGVTESLIYSLSDLPGIRVIARNTTFRYKNKDVSPKELGQELGVFAVLTGRIRQIKDRLILSLELTKVTDETQLFGVQIDQPLSEIIKVQEQIVLDIAEKLQVSIRPAAAAADRTAQLTNTRNTESYTYFLRGRYFYEKASYESIRKAIKYFQRSISHDPANNASYIGLASCYLTSFGYDYTSYSDVRRYVDPLVAIVSEQPDLDVAHALLGEKALVLDWNFEKAEHHFRSALHINSDCLIARARYARLLGYLTRFSEVSKQLQQMLEVDPLSMPTTIQVAKSFFIMGQFENALDYAKIALELEPDNYVALTIAGASFLELGDGETALRNFRQSLTVQFNIETLAMMGASYAVTEKTEAARQIIKQIELDPNYADSIKPVKLARIYLALGETDTVFKYLDRAFDERNTDLLALGVDPRWKSIRNDPRFLGLLSKIGITCGTDKLDAIA